MEVKDKRTRSERIADKVTAVMGSLPFVIIQSCILLVWVILNTVAWFHHYDSYPFILMNLVLSLQAAYTGPFVLISQNRAAIKDRETNERDLQTDMEAEQRIEAMQAQLDRIEAMLNARKRTAK